MACGANQAVSATCACQPEIAASVFASEADSAAARLALQVPTTALARIPAVAANVEYVLTEIAWSSSIGITMGICAPCTSGPAAELVMAMTVAPRSRTLASSLTISTLRPLREITITTAFVGNSANSSNSAASYKYTGLAPRLNKVPAHNAACQLLPIPVK